ncbi:MAG: hypothetical protein ABI625_03055 [bacterium]
MPSELLDRLRRFLDQTLAPPIMHLEPVARVDHFAAPPHTDPLQNTTPHWAAGVGGTWGNAMPTIQSIMIHETSGSPTYAGNETFVGRFTCMVRDDVDNRGIGPQYFVEPNGTCYTLIGEPEFANDPRRTWHGGWHDQGIDMNPVSIGVENGDIGDAGITPGSGTGPHWWALSTQSEDVTGMKAYLFLAPDGREDAILIWFAKFASEWFIQTPAVPAIKATATTPAVPGVPAVWNTRAGVRPGFQGPGDIVDGANPTNDRHVRVPKAWKNMLFTERDFRTLVLLCRFLLEKNGLPRSFPLLPYASADQDRTSVATFRNLILAEQRGDEIAVQMGTTKPIIQANAPAFAAWYGPHATEKWSRLFGVAPASAAAGSTPVTPCFRGIISHAINGGHPCPGPLFDWYRFAREVWDWWWYPFDLVVAGTTVTAATTKRPYFQARKTTPLLEYYYDAPGTVADYNALRQPLIVEETFNVPAATPIYALANGVIVAAQISGPGVGTTGLILVRHEVFNQNTGGAINYNHAPTYVWTLISGLDTSGAIIPAAPPAVAAPTPAANPTWLNRLILRLRECELAAQFHTSHAAASLALRTGWARGPSGGGPRVAIGTEIEQDALAYRAIANRLTAGNVARFPLEATNNTTPVRVCLGDFLGVPALGAIGQAGVQIEVFSMHQLPVPGAAQRVVSAASHPWWTEVTESVRHEASVDANLPAHGMAWHYGMTDFLAWINTSITWPSEWPKYGATGPMPARPITRIVT